MQREVGGRDPIGLRGDGTETAADRVDERGERAGMHQSGRPDEFGRDRDPTRRGQTRPDL